MKLRKSGTSISSEIGLLMDPSFEVSGRQLIDPGGGGGVITVQ